MKVTRGNLALLALVPILIESYIYHTWVSDLSHSVALTIFFLLGMMCIALDRVKEGTTRYISLFGKRLRGDDGRLIEFEEGYYLIPNPLPFLNYIEIFSLRLVPLAEEQDSPPLIHHYLDQRQVQYRVNSSTSFFAQSVARITGNFTSWFLSFDKYDPYRYQKLGTKILIFPLLLGYIGHSNLDQIVGYFTKTNNDALQVHVNLASDQKPVFYVGFFRTTPVYVLEAVMQDGIKYFLYRETYTGAPPQVPIDSRSCVVVPTGREVLVKTIYPPRYVVNMTDEVEYVMKKEEAGFPYSITELDIARKDGWVYLRDNWSKVRTDIYGLKARARNREASMPSTRYGGMVCF